MQLIQNHVEMAVNERRRDDRVMFNAGRQDHKYAWYYRLQILCVAYVMVTVVWPWVWAVLGPIVTWFVWSRCATPSTATPPA